MYTGKMSQIQKCYFSEFHVYKICFFSQLKSNHDIKIVREKIEKVLESDHMYRFVDENMYGIIPLMTG